MEADTLLTYAGNFGFPALVAVFLLVRMEGKLEALTQAIQRLEETLGRQQGLSSGSAPDHAD